MVQGVFEKILEDGIKQGIHPSKEQSAKDWFRNEAKKLKKHQVNEASLFRDPDAIFKNRITMGKMYFAHYDAKHKHDASALPYYDTLPLFIPFQPAKGGFLSLSLHYLDLKNRAKLFDALQQVATNQKYNEQTKLRATYEVLKGLSSTPLFAPTVKHHLVSHFRSRFLYIPTHQWDIALWLPTERFVTGGTLKSKAKAEVWKDSRQKIRDAIKKS